MLEQYLLCGWDPEDKATFAWFCSLEESQRRELVKLSKLPRIITFTDAGIREGEIVGRTAKRPPRHSKPRRSSDQD